MPIRLFFDVLQRGKSSPTVADDGARWANFVNAGVRADAVSIDCKRRHRIKRPYSVYYSCLILFTIPNFFTRQQRNDSICQSVV
jgi:hypothetical protein